MKTLLVKGWQIGFKKVACTELLQNSLGLSLSRAKATTDAILRGEAVELEVPDSTFEALITQLKELGIANCQEMVGGPN